MRNVIFVLAAEVLIVIVAVVAEMEQAPIYVCPYFRVMFVASPRLSTSVQSIDRDRPSARPVASMHRGSAWIQVEQDRSCKVVRAQRGVSATRRALGAGRDAGRRERGRANAPPYVRRALLPPPPRPSRTRATPY